MKVSEAIKELDTCKDLEKNIVSAYKCISFTGLIEKIEGNKITIECGWSSIGEIQFGSPLFIKQDQSLNNIDQIYYYDPEEDD